MNDEVYIIVCIGTATFSWSNVVYTAAEDAQWLRVVINNQQFQQIRPQHLHKHQQRFSLTTAVTASALCAWFSSLNAKHYTSLTFSPKLITTLNDWISFWLLCWKWHISFSTFSQERTRMWANAQRDGRPAEHRWRPLFNAAKFGWRPLDAVQ